MEESRDNKISMVTGALPQLVLIDQIKRMINTAKMQGNLQDWYMLMDILYSEVVGLLDEEEVKLAKQMFYNTSVIGNDHYNAPENKTKFGVYSFSLRELELWIRRKMCLHGLELPTKIKKQGRQQ